MQMKLEILISALNEGIENIENILLENHEGLQYLVNYQVCNVPANDAIIQKLEKRKDVKVLTRYEKGLSKSRNQAVKNSECEICLIADDDITLSNDVEEKIFNAFKVNPDADIITFKIKTSLARPNKKYETKPFLYNMKKLASVSSIEIAFRKSSIQKAGIVFDEEFGLGAKYPIGEEFIFLTDAYKKGLKILYWPEVIVAHPHFSSGMKIDKQTIFSRGAVFARVFGLVAFLLDIYVAFKKREQYQDQYTFFNYLKLMWAGSYDYIKPRRNP